MSKISISRGNEKLGKIPNFSMPPVATCNGAAVCGDGECGSYCYALNLYRRFPNVRAAYDRNFEMWKNSPSFTQKVLTNPVGHDILVAQGRSGS